MQYQQSLFNIIHLNSSLDIELPSKEFKTILKFNGYEFARVRNNVGN